MIVGVAGQPIEVADEQSLEQMLEEGNIIKATKVYTQCDTHDPWTNDFVYDSGLTLDASSPGSRCSSIGAVCNSPPSI